MVYFILAVSSDSSLPSIFHFEALCRLPIVTEQQFLRRESRSGSREKGKFSQDVSCLPSALWGAIFKGLQDPQPDGSLGLPASLLLTPQLVVRSQRSRVAIPPPRALRLKT